MEFTLIGDTVNLASRPRRSPGAWAGSGVLFDRATAERLGADAVLR